MVKKVSKIILIILGIVLLLAAGFVLWLSVNEYKPADVIDVKIENNSQIGGFSPFLDQELTVTSWNIGYAGLGEDSDFFMDGGENVSSADQDAVTTSLLSIYKKLYCSEDYAGGIYMLQEVDQNSSRTYGIDERDCLSIYNSSYALNYSCPFVPFPMPPIGRVNSGLLTTTLYDVASSERVALPCPFSWPVSTANLKRCLLVSYLPIEASDKKLVIVNLHLEAYDDGEGKIAQTKLLREFIQAEYEKGNYVIAGGDFNQVFPEALEQYPNTHPELWEPGTITDDIMPEGWSLAYDLSTPSCRLLNQPYDPIDTENTQYYVIDGFIISPNVELISVETVDEGFEFSDHNPVRLKVKLIAAA